MWKLFIIIVLYFAIIHCPNPLKMCVQKLRQISKATLPAPIQGTYLHLIWLLSSHHARHQLTIIRFVKIRAAHRVDGDLCLCCVNRNTLVVFSIRRYDLYVVDDDKMIVSQTQSHTQINVSEREKK